MMMQKDEENALSKLSHFEQTIKSETSNFDGEIVKMYGDGSLVLFSSALKALNCAINIQKCLYELAFILVKLSVRTMTYSEMG